MAPAAPAIPLVVEGEGAASTAATRVRLKPRMLAPVAAAAPVGVPLSVPTLTFETPPAIEPPSAPVAPEPAAVPAPLAVERAETPLASQPSALAGEGLKFKLKPKVGAPPAPAAAAAGTAPAAPVAPPLPGPKFPPPPGLANPKSALPPPPVKAGAAGGPPSPSAAPKPLPPFLVVAPLSTDHNALPIPRIAVPAEASPKARPAPVVAKQPSALKKNVLLASAAALLVLSVGGYFAWTELMSPPAALPPPVAVKPKPAVVAPVAAAPTPTAPATSSAATKAAGPLTPVDTMNALAKAPVNAINKARDAVAARAASGQSRIDPLAAGQDVPEKPAAGNSGGAATATGTAMANQPATTAAATLAPGVSATSSGGAAVVEASPAFRAFVANVKITGTMQSSPARIILNGRLARAGDVVDSALGIVFDGIDSEKKQLIFKDKSGAIVTKKN